MKKQAGYQEIILEKDHANGVAVLMINRPQYHNALFNGSIRMELITAVGGCRGGRRHRSAGADRGGGARVLGGGGSA